MAPTELFGWLHVSGLNEAGTIVNMLRLLDGGILPFDRPQEFLPQAGCDLWIMSQLLDA